VSSQKETLSIMYNGIKRVKTLGETKTKMECEVCIEELKTILLKYLKI